MGKFVAVCRVEQVAEGRGFPVEVDGLRVAIYRNRDRYFALSGRCPHANGPMGLGWVEDGEAVCPLHRWRFNLATGRCTTVRGHALHRYWCAVREGQIWVEV
ncbi:MAG: Rieske (2Fe-2S) protein [Planctomycetaceae bacterium]|jgi:nitrite reductase (NADH) small subunit|nr:Rieske (2Fe-2S) protein [Planctomycetaceae bacterium]MBV8314478.1 Rieske (2Fe-2S) protein [Planctomycetaceae bacterium]MBV8383614.1 Rieske (2Fe-2S) protein [Planctomycetaceae bacterium]MBV8606660.1 Rieske (2Fe-2S) protein [Singulisphaera sp.]